GLLHQGGINTSGDFLRVAFGAESLRLRPAEQRLALQIAPLVDCAGTGPDPWRKRTGQRRLARARKSPDGNDLWRRGIEMAESSFDIPPCPLDGLRLAT